MTNEHPWRPVDADPPSGADCGNIEVRKLGGAATPGEYSCIDELFDGENDISLYSLTLDGGEESSIWSWDEWRPQPRDIG